MELMADQASAVELTSRRWERISGESVLRRNLRTY
jgi:hypothetical protein